MKILFSMRHPGVLRNFASTLEALAARNHQIHLVFGQLDAERDDRLLDDLTRAHPNITCDEVRRKTSWRLWLGVGRVARIADRDELDVERVNPAAEGVGDRELRGSST